MSNDNNFVIRFLNEKLGMNAEREALKSQIENMVAETKSLQGAIQYLVEEAYWEGPISITPDTLVSKLGELDSGLIDDMIDRRQWDMIGGVAPFYSGDFDMARKRAVENSIYMSIYNPLVRWMINVWTNYGMGDSVKITCNNEDANTVFQEFWDAERNSSVLSADTIQYLSLFLLRGGNIFLAFFASKDDGKVTIDEIPMDEIHDIVTNPERKSEKLFYKRVYSDKAGSHEIYYPDWQAKLTGRITDEMAARVLPKDAVRADVPKLQNEILNDIETKLGTDVCVLHVPFNRMIQSSYWGWPLLTSTGYVKRHQRFVDDRLTVSASKAMVVRRKQVTGGNRAVDSIKRGIASTLSGTNRSETNPPAGAGGIEIENQSVKTTDMPMTTGAGDAKNDNELFSWIALLEGGIFPTTAGLDTSRWATALAMDKTLAMQWSRYQTFWSGQFKRIVKIVLMFAELYGGKKFIDADGNSEYEATISIDTLSLVDFPDIVTSLSQASRDILLPYLSNGTIPVNTAKLILKELWMIMLQALGISGSSDIITDEKFEILDDDELAALKDEEQNIPDEEPETVDDETLAALPPEVQEFILEMRAMVKDGVMDADSMADIMNARLEDG